jgi:hypothetical protein
MTRTTPAFRAYDVTTEWQGPPRDTIDAAAVDARAHNDGCRRQGGYGSAVVVENRDGRLVDLDGDYVWPASGRTSGAARWCA